VLTRKKKDKDCLEVLRQLLHYDRTHRYRGRSKKPQCVLVGVDEVGRGCFAGPVVAAAVLLPEIDDRSEIAQALSELNDSKLLSALQRERLAKIIHEIAICAIGQASPDEINEINILQASLLAMRRALEKLSPRIPNELPVLVLVDGNKAIRDIHHIQTTVIQGDSTSASIAAASVIAKVYRDALMTDLAKSFPEYSWHQNKGYGSRTHREALKKLGMTCHHRKLFCQKHISGEVIDGTDLEDYMEDLVNAALLN
jgi:ribonuclease HII